MTDEAGAKLLAHVESLMAEMRGLRDGQRDIRAQLRDVSDNMPRVSPDAMRMRKMRGRNSERNMRQGGDRNTTGRAVSVTTRNGKPSKRRNGDGNAPQISSSLVVDLDLVQKDLPAVTATVTPTSNGEHPELVAFFVQAVERVTGVSYGFRDEDGRHAKDLLKRFGLAEAKRIVDLAAERYEREQFHRDRGLTFRLVASDANALRTAQGQATPRRAQGVPAPAASREMFQQAAAKARTS